MGSRQIGVRRVAQLVAVVGLALAAASAGQAAALSVQQGGCCIASRGKPGTYRPSRTLPRDKHGHPVPDSDAPHTQVGERTSKRTGETYTQAREFDSQGRPVRDVDFTTHGRGDHVNPHQHSYDPQTGKRLGPEPLQ